MLPSEVILAIIITTKTKGPKVPRNLWETWRPGVFVAGRINSKLYE